MAPTAAGGTPARQLLTKLLVVCAVLAGNGCSESPPIVAARHVVLVSIDTLRRDHVTAYGYERNTTPNLEDLARSGIVFENAFAANTNTAPSHASMLTGLHPHTHGIQRNGYRLGDGVETLGQRLGDGFARAAFVSGYPMQRGMTGLDRGFDHYDDDFGSDWQRGAEGTFQRTQKWLEQRGSDSRPIFLLFHLYDPHHPYDAPEGFAERFLPGGRKAFRFPVEESTYQRFWDGAAPPAELEEYVMRYDGEIVHADHYVGRLFDTLKRFSYWEQALVLVISDHGEALGERSAPFTHGGRVYDEQIRVPLILRLPGDRHAGSRIAEQVHHIDVAPTILDFLGIGGLPKVHGRSMRPLIEAPDSPAADRPVFSTALPQRWRVPEVVGEFKYDVLVSSIRTPSWKLISYPGIDGEIFQLFDLETDPRETSNLAAARDEKRAELRQSLVAWRREAGDRESVPPPTLSPEEEKALRALGYID
jgi:arylsulfatase A-like enzyme